MHTLNLGCSFITFRELSNNQRPRCDIAWVHVTNHLYHLYASHSIFQPFNLETNKTDHHDILVTEILLKVALNTITQPTNHHNLISSGVLFILDYFTGIGRSFAYCPAVVIVGYYFHKKRGRAVGIATSGVGFGSFVIPPIIEIVFKHYGFTGAFMIIGGITFNLAVFGILMRPLSAHRRIEAIQSRYSSSNVFIMYHVHVPYLLILQLSKRLPSTN